MPHPSWNESYAAGELPWDSGEPEPLLVEFVTSGRVQPTLTLEIGAARGTNSLWLAERGFEVLASISPGLRSNEPTPNWRVAVSVAVSPPWTFWRPPRTEVRSGCFHVFDEPEERPRFSARVVAALAPGGLWLSLFGSTEGPPREVGPPRRSAREIFLAIPHSKLSNAVSPSFAVTVPRRGSAWLLT